MVWHSPRRLSAGLRAHAEHALRVDDSRLIELASHLSALAGMKMKDVGPLALALPRDRAEAVEAALLLRDEAKSISALLEAAAFLIVQTEEFKPQPGLD